MTFVEFKPICLRADRMQFIVDVRGMRAVSHSAATNKR